MTDVTFTGTTVINPTLVAVVSGVGPFVNKVDDINMKCSLGKADNPCIYKLKNPSKEDSKEDDLSYTITVEWGYFGKWQNIIPFIQNENLPPSDYKNYNIYTKYMKFTPLIWFPLQEWWKIYTEESYIDFLTTAASSEEYTNNFIDNILFEDMKTYLGTTLDQVKNIYKEIFQLPKVTTEDNVTWIEMIHPVSENSVSDYVELLFSNLLMDSNYYIIDSNYNKTVTNNFKLSPEVDRYENYQYIYLNPADFSLVYTPTKADPKNLYLEIGRKTIHRLTMWSGRLTMYTLKWWPDAINAQNSEATRYRQNDYVFPPILKYVDNDPKTWDLFNWCTRQYVSKSANFIEPSLYFFVARNELCDCITKTIIPSSIRINTTDQLQTSACFTKTCKSNSGLPIEDKDCEKECSIITSWLLNETDLSTITNKENLDTVKVKRVCGFNYSIYKAHTNPTLIVVGILIPIVITLLVALIPKWSKGSSRGFVSGILFFILLAISTTVVIAYTGRIYCVPEPEKQVCRSILTGKIIKSSLCDSTKCP